MPWHEKAMKDAVTCEKRRLGGSNLWPGDVRMGQPNLRNGGLHHAEFIGVDVQTGRTETSKYPKEDKEIRFPE